MIDLHSHILPGLDDGAEDLDSALEMVIQLRDAGFRTLVATPHVIVERDFLTVDGIMESSRLLQRELKEQGVEIDILAGAENYIFPEMARYVADGKLMTLGNAGKYLLLELPLLEVPVYTEQVFFELQLQGVTPVLAHPERYAALYRDPDRILAWAEQGVLYQLDLRSVQGRYGSDAHAMAMRMLESGLIHFLGSDVHYPSRRSNPYADELQLIRHLTGEEKFLQLTEEYPQAAIEGKELSLPNAPARWAEKKGLAARLRSFWAKK